MDEPVTRSGLVGDDAQFLMRFRLILAKLGKPDRDVVLTLAKTLASLSSHPARASTHSCGNDCRICTLADQLPQRLSGNGDDVFLRLIPGSFLGNFARNSAQVIHQVPPVSFRQSASRRHGVFSSPDDREQLAVGLIF